MKIEVTGEKTSLDSHVTSFKKCKQVYFESGEGGTQWWLSLAETTVLHRYWDTPSRVIHRRPIRGSLLNPHVHSILLNTSVNIHLISHSICSVWNSLYILKLFRSILLGLCLIILSMQKPSQTLFIFVLVPTYKESLHPSIQNLISILWFEEQTYYLFVI